MQLANKQTDADNKLKYHNIKISENFKKFCSILIYEAILRIGEHLKEVVALKSVKTVNETLINHSLQQLCNICGVDFAPIKADMQVRLDKFEVYSAERGQTRRAKRKNAAVKQADQADQAGQDDQDGDEESAEEEAGDDAAVEYED
jgi:hypothetical protein